MKVFLSWSGNKSEKIAMVFRDWLPNVIQEIEPFMSSEDIDKGARWSEDIAKELTDTSFGILCVTRENIAAPWLIFEAGALSKKVDSARVCPFLFDIKQSEMKGPLIQFQSANHKEKDLKDLVSSINKACEKNPLSEERFNETFDLWYPNLDKKLTELNNAKDEADGEEDNGAPDTKENPEISEILEEILELTRTNQKLIRASGRHRLIASREDLRLIDSLRASGRRRLIASERDLRSIESLDELSLLTGAFLAHQFPGHDIIRLLNNSNLIGEDLFDKKEKVYEARFLSKKLKSELLETREEEDSSKNKKPMPPRRNRRSNV